MPHPCGLSGEVVALQHAGSGAGSLGIQLGGVLEVTGAFVQVRRRRGVTGQVGGTSARAFFDVHMTISEPFQVNAIGMERRVPSLAT